jgi:hypothetical protein
VILSEAIADCGVMLLSTTFTLNAKVLAVVGVPLIKPDADRLSPLGSAPDTKLQVVGVSLAESEKLKIGRSVYSQSQTRSVGTFY